MSALSCVMALSFCGLTPHARANASGVAMAAARMLQTGRGGESAGSLDRNDASFHLGSDLTNCQPRNCAIALSLLSLTPGAWAEAGGVVKVVEPAPQIDASGDDAGSRDGADAGFLAVSAPASYRSLTGKERWNLYLRDAVWSPGAFFRAAGPAAGEQLNNEPAEWGQGARGYGKRFANRFGRFALRESYEAAAAAALGHEVRYLRGGRSGFLPRAAHALSANFVTVDRNGRRTANVARLGSVFAAEFTANLWMPAGYRDASTAMRGAVMQLGVSSAFNLIREFAPELKRVFTWK